MSDAHLDTVAKPDSDIARLEQEVRSLEAELDIAAERFLEAEEAQLKALDDLQQLLRKDSPLAENTRIALQETKYALSRAEQKLHSLNQLYASLVRSASWRYTKPFRALARLLHGDKELFAEGLWNQVRPYAEILPRQRVRPADQVSYRLIDVLAPLLKHSSGYRRWHEAYQAQDLPLAAGKDLNQSNFASETTKLTFKKWPDPRLSVIIMANGDLKNTLAALRSLSVFSPSCAFEVIVAEETSDNAEMQRLRSVENITWLEYPKALGIVCACNQASAAARAGILFFLGGHAEVTSGALDRLLELFDQTPGIGLAGSKIVSPRGRLYQAGGIVWQDGSRTDFGQLADPAGAQFNVLRETDYCSLDAMMLPRALFERLDRLDERYQSGPVAVVDLAFKVRQSGLKVIYQPRSTVIDGKDAGSSNDADNHIALEESDEKIFCERWANVLARDQFPIGTSLFPAKDRCRNKSTLLVIDQSIPAGDQDAGSRSLIQFMETFLHMGMNVKFWPQDRLDDKEYAGRLQRLGIEVLLEEKEAWAFSSWYQEHSAYIDYVLLSRPHVSVDFLPTVKAKGNAKVLFYGHDIHYLRLAMQREAAGEDEATRQSFEFFKKLEPELWPQMDVIYYPSESETREVLDSLGDNPSHTAVRTVPVYAFASFPSPAVPPDQRRGLLFVGGFKHLPNADGVVWFKNEVLPLIHQRFPDTTLTIVGSSPTPRVTALADRLTTVTGYISDQELERYYATARVCVAPLRFGAGMKGKVAEALRFGVPVVTTEVGAQGLATDAIATASDAQSFADAVIARLADDNLWQTSSDASQQFARSHLSQAALRDIFQLDVTC